MPTDTEILNWLAQRVDYLEHRDAAGTRATEQPGQTGYWIPGVTESNWRDEAPAAAEPPDCVGLDLREYVVEQLRRERAL